jgi:RNA polymerase sigma-70 factor (ECF subfamily)
MAGSAEPMTSMTVVTDLSDEELVARLAGEDVRALEILYDRHSRSVMSLAYKMLGESETAEEVVQETFMRLWNRPTAFSPERGRFTSWLLGVAHHRAIDLLRRRRLEQRHLVATDSEFLESNWIDPGDEVVSMAEGRDVIQALNLLPDAQRMVVELAFIRGFTHSEIAQWLHEPIGTVKTRLRLAMQKLRTALVDRDLSGGAA